MLGPWRRRRRHDRDKPIEANGPRFCRAPAEIPDRRPGESRATSGPKDDLTNDRRTNPRPSRSVGARTIRTLVVAEIRFYREGLSKLLDGRRCIRVVGTAADAREALASVRRLGPAIAVVDLAMPNSVGGIRRLAAADPSLRVIALAIREDAEDVVACAEAGVAGYVTRDASLDELVRTVESVARDEMPCSPRMAATLLRRVGALAAAAPPMPATDLTSREVEIVALLDDGLSNKEIATELSIEIGTVKNHVHNILEKLAVTRRGQAAAKARRLGLRLPPVSAGTDLTD